MDPNKTVDLFGYEVFAQTRSMMIDLTLACIVIFFIMLPQLCFRVDTPKEFRTGRKKME